MNTSEDPYRSPQIDEVGLEKSVATWRLVVGTTFRVIGVVLITIPVLALVKELFRSGFRNPSLDFLAIFLTVVFFLALGRMFIIWANRISTGRRLFGE
ncbi:MAG: hypothetical protein ACPGLY_10510 [Rubripirellula sp.]